MRLVTSRGYVSVSRGYEEVGGSTPPFSTSTITSQYIRGVPDVWGAVGKSSDAPQLAKGQVQAKNTSEKLDSDGSVSLLRMPFLGVVESDSKASCPFWGPRTYFDTPPNWPFQIVMIEQGLVHRHAAMDAKRTSINSHITFINFSVPVSQGVTYYYPVQNQPVPLLQMP